MRQQTGSQDITELFRQVKDLKTFKDLPKTTWETPAPGGFQKSRQPRTLTTNKRRPTAQF